MRLPWIEAMRLHTLPVSVAGVLGGTAVAIALHGFRWIPALLCLVFALLAQIASNLANEYFDFRKGLDKKGREGFRRGVTEGDISPRAMLIATLLTLGLACLCGCGLIFYGGWWLIAVGVAVVIFALAYSAGPYPLSHHGLGDVAVVVFFGIVPVCLTTWLQTGDTSCLRYSFPVSLGIGFVAANVLIVNNYRDMDDDSAVGKLTTVVIFGRKKMARVYLFDAFVGYALIWIPMIFLSHNPIFATLCFVAMLLSWLISRRNWILLTTLQGSALNEVLRRTAASMMQSTLLLLLIAICL